MYFPLEVLSVFLGVYLWFFLSGESIGVKRIRLLVTADAGGHGRVGLDLYLAGSEPQMTTDDHR